MSSKIHLIRLEPENITFDMLEKEPTVILKVHNTSEKLVAFKVKTTHPKRYLVRPNQDVISVGGYSTVKISLQIKDAKQLRQEKISGVKTLDKDCRDNKFLVQCAVVKDAFLPQVKEIQETGNSKEIGNKLKGMWAETTRDELVNKKLMCLFEYPSDTETLRSVNNIEGVSVPFATPIAPDSGLNLTTQSVDSMEDIVELRKKYQELINFTVQLTAERDRFKSSLKESVREVQLLKKGQSNKASSARSLDSGADIADAVDTVTGAFSLWQVMLVAVVAFLMGRLIVN